MTEQITREELKQDLWGDERKAYDPRFVAEFGPAAAIFLSQLFHWEGKGHDPDGWIYKTEKEWKEETGLVRNQQRQARKRLIERGVLEVEARKGVPPKNYYRIDLLALARILGVVDAEEQPDTGKPETLNQRYVETDGSLNDETGGSLNVKADGSLNDRAGGGPIDEADGSLNIQKRTSEKTTEATSKTLTSENPPTGGADGSESRHAPRREDEREKSAKEEEPTPDSSNHRQNYDIDVLPDIDEEGFDPKRNYEPSVAEPTNASNRQRDFDKDDHPLSCDCPDCTARMPKYARPFVGAA